MNEVVSVAVDAFTASPPNCGGAVVHVVHEPIERDEEAALIVPVYPTAVNVMLEPNAAVEADSDTVVPITTKLAVVETAAADESVTVIVCVAMLAVDGMVMVGFDEVLNAPPLLTALLPDASARVVVSNLTVMVDDPVKPLPDIDTDVLNGPVLVDKVIVAGARTVNDADPAFDEASVKVTV